MTFFKILNIFLAPLLEEQNGSDKRGSVAYILTKLELQNNNKQTILFSIFNLHIQQIFK